MVQKEESDPPDRSEYLLRQRCQNLGSLHANPSEIFPKQFWVFFCQKKNPKSINTLTPNFKRNPEQKEEEDAPAASFFLRFRLPN